MPFKGVKVVLGAPPASSVAESQTTDDGLGRRYRLFIYISCLGAGL